jgi:hypothetical protein
MHLHHAAERLGDIVAKGEMADADASATIVSWVEKVNGVDRPGLRARLHWTMRDRAIAAQRQRENVVTAIRWAVRPLFDARTSAAEIEEAAGRANGEILPWEDVASILREEMTRAIKQRRG